MIDLKSCCIMTVLLMAAPSVAFAGPTAVVPEPSSLAILAAGVVGAAAVKFRKRK
jgi:hypothetical protein